MATVYISEAMRSENDSDKTGWGGKTKPGDQLQTVSEGVLDTKGEVRIDPWRSGFTMVCRYKDRNKAKAHAEASRFFCNSKHVGYSQKNRLTLKNAVKALGYTNYKKLNKDKETDCSAMQCLCCNIVGITEVKDWNSTEMLVQMPKLTAYFDIFTSDKYINSPDYLMEGDILIKDGHVACVDNDGDKANEGELITVLAKPTSYKYEIAGRYQATEDVNMRYGPNSKKYAVIRVIKKGVEVYCTGDYTGDWYYVRTSDNVYGFIKKTYLKLIESLAQISTTLAEPKSKNNALAGKYVATTDVNMRYGPDSSIYKVIRIVKKGELVNNYGYYTGNWLYVKDTKGNKGYINKSYLKKK